jgi:hypothetical protein
MQIFGERMQVENYLATFKKPKKTNYVPKKPKAFNPEEEHEEEDNEEGEVEAPKIIKRVKKTQNKQEEPAATTKKKKLTLRGTRKLIIESE